MIKKIRNIIFTYPQEHRFYDYVLSEIEKAFEKKGFNSLGIFPISNPKDWNLNVPERTWIFCINYFKDDFSPTLQKNLFITWLIDALGRDISKLGSSDLNFFYLDGWNHLYAKTHKNSHSKQLLPGVSLLPTEPSWSQENYASKTYDWSFFGAMPRWWRAEELDRKIRLSNGKFVTFESILNHLKGQKKVYTQYWIDEDFLQMINELLISRYGSTLDLGWLEQKPFLRFDLGHRINRILRRIEFLETALKATQSAFFIGPTSWKGYSQFAPYYKKFIDYSNITELSNTVKRAKVTLHEGPGIHFRILQAMAWGVPVVIHRLNGIDGAQMVHQHFTNGKDVFITTLDELHDCLQHIINDNNLLVKVAKSAYEKIVKFHLWLHRVDEIINEMDSI